MKSTGFTGTLLDRYLAHGWYRMGTRMFTCRYNFYDWGFLATIWTRLPLVDHRYPKGTAKVVRRNATRFRTEVRPAQATAEEERVFELYLSIKSYDLGSSAASYLEMDAETPFKTYQTCVYDGDKLIAFSYFDLGKNSVQSVCGFYDPAYAKHSLGLYTMTLEIDWCKAQSFSYHYAGYIVPGNDVFEYKRRVGKLEYFNDVVRLWLPIDLMQRDELPDAYQREALENYDELYTQLGKSYSVRMRPQFFIGITQQELQWLRREQLPFAITDDRSNRRPYWACHFYSFNFKRYFSMLCTTHAFERETFAIPEDLRQKRRPNKSYEFVGSGMAVRLLHYSTKPYQTADLQKVWQEVELANEAYVE